MSTNAFRNTTLFKSIPWQTTAPETLDLTRLPREAERFREALVQADPAGGTDDLELFCSNYEANQCQDLDISQSLKDFSTSAGQRGRICSSILQHRVIDFLSWKQQGLQTNISTGMTAQRRPLPSMSHLPIAQLKHWFRIPISAKASLDAYVEPTIPLPHSDDASRAFMHLSRIARTGQKANLLKIMNNIDAASMHLSYLLEGNLELPESLETFTRHMLRQNPNVASETIVGVMNHFDMAKLRVPLITAMTISPLCLLTNAVLMDRSISEEKFCNIWWAQGSNRPSLLQEVEYEILGIIWDNATQSIDLQARLQQTLPRIINHLQNNIHDPALHWFNEAVFFNPICPAPLPIVPVETATDNPNFEKREEEEEEEEEQEQDTAHNAHEEGLKVQQVDQVNDANEEGLKVQEGHASGIRVYGQHGRTQGGDRNDASNNEESGTGYTTQMAVQHQNPQSELDETFQDQNLLSEDEVTAPDYHYLVPQTGWDMGIGWRTNMDCHWEDYDSYTFMDFDHQHAENIDDEDGEVDKQEATRRNMVQGLMRDIFDDPETGESDGVSKNSDQEEKDELMDDGDGGETNEKGKGKMNSHAIQRETQHPVSTSLPNKRASTRKGDSQHPTRKSTMAEAKNPRRTSRVKKPEIPNSSSLPSLIPPKKRKAPEERKDKKPVSKASNSSIGPIKFISPRSSKYEVIDLTREREKDAIIAQELNGVMAEKTHIAPAHNLFPLDRGNPESHEARFHFPEDAEWYHQMMLAAEQSYVNGKPSYLESPETSAIQVIEMEAFNKMSDGDVQAALRSRHLVITGGPKEAYGFTPSGLETLGSLQKPILIHDLSEPVDDDYNTRHRSGQLSDMYKASRSPKGKALNSLDFPMDLAPHPPTSFSTDVKAWTRTDGPENKSETYPVKSMRWGLAATSGAYHKWHIDADGDGTYVGVKVGRKVWFIGRPKVQGEYAEFASRSLYLGDYDMDKPNLHQWDVEAIVLTPGTCLIMRPNTPHAVYTPDPCICHGGHCLFRSTILDTCYGGFHSFVLSTVVTNAENTKNVRLLLRRMMEFFAQIITKNCLQLDEDWVSKSDLEHVPDITSFQGLLEIVTLYNFMELSNITNAKLYGEDNTSRDRHAAIDGRKISRSLLEIIFCHFRLVDKTKQEIPSHENFILPYIAQQVKCLLAYKYKAESKGAHSSDPNCTYDAVVMAVRRHYIGDDQFAAAFNQCKKYETFAWQGPTWSIERRPKPLKPIEHTGKTYDDSLWMQEEVEIISTLPELALPWEGEDPNESNDEGDHDDGDQPPPQKKQRLE